MRVGQPGHPSDNLGNEGNSTNLAVDAYYNPIRPKAGNDTWLIEITMTLLFPK